MGLLIFSHKLLEGNELPGWTYMRKYTNQIMTNVQILLGMQQLYGAKLTSCQRPITERSHMPDLISSLLQHSPLSEIFFLGCSPFLLILLLWLIPPVLWYSFCIRKTLSLLLVILLGEKRMLLLLSLGLALRLLQHILRVFFSCCSKPVFAVTTLAKLLPEKTRCLLENELCFLLWQLSPSRINIRKNQLVFLRLWLRRALLHIMAIILSIILAMIPSKLLTAENLLLAIMLSRYCFISWALNINKCWMLIN